LDSKKPFSIGYANIEKAGGVAEEEPLPNLIEALKSSNEISLLLQFKNHLEREN